MGSGSSTVDQSAVVYDSGKTTNKQSRSFSSKKLKGLVFKQDRADKFVASERRSQGMSEPQFQSSFEDGQSFSSSPSGQNKLRSLARGSFSPKEGFLSTHKKQKKDFDAERNEAGEAIVLRVLPDRTRFLVRRRLDNRLFALERIKIFSPNTNDFKNIHEELAIFRKMDHPNIAQLNSAVVDKKSEILFLKEYCSGGGLGNYLEERIRLNESETVDLVRQMLSVVNYLHGKSLVHGNLRLSSWDFSSPACDVLKLTDMSSVKSMSGHSSISREHGFNTTNYVFHAPEVLRGIYSYPADCWSIGMVTFTLLFGNYAYSNSHDPVKLHKTILKKTKALLESAQMDVSSDCKDWLRGMLDIDQEARTNTTASIQHPWFTSFALDPAHSAFSSAKKQASIQRLINSAGEYINKCLLARLALQLVAFDFSSEDFAETDWYVSQICENGSVEIDLNEFSAYLEGQLSFFVIESIFNSTNLADTVGNIDRCGLAAILMNTETLEVTHECLLMRAFNKLSGFTSHITCTSILDVIGKGYHEQEIMDIFEEAYLICEFEWNPAKHEIDFTQFVKIIKATRERRWEDNNDLF
mmetsp:Transcript_28767/g.46554  ORF Transcript_28767/g.46554 Transcript_28767/m.46554 type:complete len:582 (+) Transcript_28767:168-1913(+)